MLIISYLVLLVATLLIISGHVKNRLDLFITGLCMPVVLFTIYIIILLT